ncbi:MAG TPA: tail fiber protein [Pyrinomonadaceae bacterium]|jgi:microcystin-dependent protein|nr:tail fiber protein [Pyrinomonadaceae bacterium]
MADPFVAEIRIFPFNFAPKGWAFCDGQLMPISQNTALFSLLGTTYGGDGKSTFALPNLQGSAPMHPGQGPGLSLHDLGETGGTETVTLLSSEMPAHAHLVGRSTATAGDSLTPVNNIWAQVPSGRATLAIYHEAPPTGAMNATAISVAGGDQPHNNMQPYLTLNFCIALQGVFPPRT